jgi:hypothetical protein
LSDLQLSARAALPARKETPVTIILVGQYFGGKNPSKGTIW